MTDLVLIADSKLYPHPAHVLRLFVFKYPHTGQYQSFVISALNFIEDDDVVEDVVGFDAPLVVEQYQHLTALYELVAPQ